MRWTVYNVPSAANLSLGEPEVETQLGEHEMNGNDVAVNYLENVAGENWPEDFGPVNEVEIEKYHAAMMEEIAKQRMEQAQITYGEGVVGKNWLAQ